MKTCTKIEDKYGQHYIADYGVLNIGRGGGTKVNIKNSSISSVTAKNKRPLYLRSKQFFDK